jgi:acetolactate synthase-1/2/3 large subunit
MTVAQYIIDTLAKLGVRHIFGYIGARNIALVEAVYDNPEVKFVNVYHEHTAAFAACGYAQAGGTLGVATSTRGPGATNMLTGIANAYCDSIPTLFLTGQVSTGALRGERRIRNNAAQEVDIVAMAQPVTKYAVQITNASDIRRELEKCVYLATSGRCGPVLLDLPENISFMKIEPETLEAYAPPVKKVADVSAEFAKLSALVANSTRPVLLVGNGAHGFEREISELAASTKVPVVASMSAVDVCDNSLENYLGVCGNTGLRCANFALTDADLIISLGCSCTARYTGADLSKFAENAKVVRVDIDAEELKARTIKPDELKINCNIQELLDCGILSQLLPSTEWLKNVADNKQKYFRETATQPYEYMRALDAKRLPNDIVALDVGQHQNWALQSLTFSQGQQVLSPSGLSSMGYALPAAIGAYYAKPEVAVICIVGDGGLQMTLTELQTVIRENIPITVVVMNNSVLGFITQLQDDYYEQKHFASEVDYTVPDFVKLALDYGLEAWDIKSALDLSNALAEFPKRPRLLNVRVDPKADVRPRITERRPMWDMFPLIKTTNQSKELSL